MNQVVKDIFSYRPYWAKKLGPAPFLPMNQEEMHALGWNECDIILVTGDAYVDHPSFGMAIVGRFLEAQGFRVGIIAQPDWHDIESFKVLGEPKLFFGVTSGNMDSMVNRYTSDRKPRSDDAYTPSNQANKRPDRAVIVYSQLCHKAYPDTPIIIGGIEASLRRIAHYDYWSDKVRHSILIDSQADLLVYGNAERAIVEIAHSLAQGNAINTLMDIRGTALIIKDIPENTHIIDATDIDIHSKDLTVSNNIENTVIRLPSFEQVKDNKTLYAHASRIMHLETNPANARALLQQHNRQQVWINPPPIPLTTQELDKVFALPFQRIPHPSYNNATIPAYEMIKFSINIMRGCFGGCTFCSITEHEGRIIQNRSHESILQEIEAIRDHTPGFTGNISDLGGPTANMYRLACKSKEIESKCRKLFCVYPGICPNLNTDHSSLVSLYKKAREVQGVKKIFIASGLRYDLAVESPEYIKELATHHVGGYLKIAPEHTEENPLSKMMKPGIATYDKFKQLFEKYSRAAGKEQYLIPYFIAAHPGTSNQDMVQLALWLKKNNFRLEQVQTFLPSPMALATTMYHSQKNPLKKITEDSETVLTPKKAKERKLHKALLRYHDPINWPVIREALRAMGKANLIGNSKKYHLVPAYQPGNLKKIKKLD